MYILKMKDETNDDWRICVQNTNKREAYTQILAEFKGKIGQGTNSFIILFGYPATAVRDMAFQLSSCFENISSVRLNSCYTPINYKKAIVNSLVVARRTSVAQSEAIELIEEMIAINNFKFTSTTLDSEQIMNIIFIFWTCADTRNETEIERIIKGFAEKLGKNCTVYYYHDEVEVKEQEIAIKNYEKNQRKIKKTDEIVTEPDLFDKYQQHFHAIDSDQKSDQILLLLNSSSAEVIKKVKDQLSQNETDITEVNENDRRNDEYIERGE